MRRWQWVGVATSLVLTAFLVVTVLRFLGDPVVGVQGVVRDESGAPLGDVVVTLEADQLAPHADTTADGGSYSVALIGTDLSHTRIRFQKEHYATILLPVGTETQSVLDVTMVSGVPKGAAPADRHDL